jgi:hypothetical protein
MNRYRMRYQAKPAVKKPAPEDDSGSSEAELTKSADDIFSVAADHRAGVIARDKATKARKKKGTRRE